MLNKTAIVTNNRLRLNPEILQFMDEHAFVVSLQPKGTQCSNDDVRQYYLVWANKACSVVHVMEDEIVYGDLLPAAKQECIILHHNYHVSRPIGGLIEIAKQGNPDDPLTWTTEEMIRANL